MKRMIGLLWVFLGAFGHSEESIMPIGDSRPEGHFVSAGNAGRTLSYAYQLLLKNEHPLSEDYPGALFAGIDGFSLKPEDIVGAMEKSGKRIVIGYKSLPDDEKGPHYGQIRVFRVVIFDSTDKRWLNYPNFRDEVRRERWLDDALVPLPLGSWRLDRYWGGTTEFPWENEQWTISPSGWVLQCEQWLVVGSQKNRERIQIKIQKFLCPEFCTPNMALAGYASALHPHGYERLVKRANEQRVLVGADQNNGDGKAVVSVRWLSQQAEVRLAMTTRIDDQVVDAYLKKYPSVLPECLDRIPKGIEGVTELRWLVQALKECPPAEIDEDVAIGTKPWYRSQRFGGCRYDLEAFPDLWPVSLDVAHRVYDSARTCKAARDWPGYFSKMQSFRIELIAKAEDLLKQGEIQGFVYRKSYPVPGVNYDPEYGPPHAYLLKGGKLDK